MTAIGAATIDLSTISDNVGWVVAITGGLITLGVVARRGWHSVRVVVRKANAVVDTLVGREAIHHPETGAELVAASPGVGTRMAHQETQMDLLATTVTKLVDQQAQQQRLEAVVGEHGTRLSDLEAASVERIVTRVESAQAWRTMETAIGAETHALPDDDDQPR